MANKYKLFAGCRFLFVNLSCFTDEMLFQVVLIGPTLSVTLNIAIMVEGYYCRIMRRAVIGMTACVMMIVCATSCGGVEFL